MKSAVAGLIISLSIVTLVYPQEPAVPAMDKEVDASRVLVYRMARPASAAIPYVLFINSTEPVGQLKNREMMEYYVLPGKVTVGGTFKGKRNPQRIQFEAEKGKQYLFVIDGSRTEKPLRQITGDPQGFRRFVDRIDKQHKGFQPQLVAREQAKEKTTRQLQERFKAALDSARQEGYEQGKTEAIGTQTLNTPTPRKIADSDVIGISLTEELEKRKYHALVIGIRNYQDDEIVDLREPVSDAQNLVNVLTTSYTFQKEDITLLEDPTRNEIIEAFDELAATVAETDNLLIFYAGHGIWDEQLEQGFWLPSDAKKNSKAQWLSNGTIRDYVRGIRSKHTLLISDACFSGGIFLEREAFNTSKAMLELYKLTSRKAMTSGALNTVPDKSVFMEYLLKNLQTNAEPLISAEQLFSNFKLAVINNSPNGQVPQFGTIRQADDEGGDFIFLRKMK